MTRWPSLLITSLQRLSQRVYVLQILKTFCELESSKIPVKTPFESQQILFKQDSVNINWVNVRFYAPFAGSILLNAKFDGLQNKIKKRKAYGHGKCG